MSYGYILAWIYLCICSHYFYYEQDCPQGDCWYLTFPIEFSFYSTNETLHRWMWNLVWTSCTWPIIRPHRSTFYLDAAYCYRPNSMVWTHQDAVWVVDSGVPEEACLTWECTLAQPDEYNWTVHVRWWCGLFVKLLWTLVLTVVTMLKDNWWLPICLSCISTTTVLRPFAGTTLVSQCQKRTSGLYGANED